jgi:hypothetical protein
MKLNLSCAIGMPSGFTVAGIKVNRFTFATGAKLAWHANKSAFLGRIVKNSDTLIGENRVSRAPDEQEPVASLE